MKSCKDGGKVYPNCFVSDDNEPSLSMFRAVGYRGCSQKCCWMGVIVGNRKILKT
ncbi:hypothetical protein BC829DRAFT_403974 [Chytridium lagenaria]|nr:hypothetical protein BC829DRAFT_403974 [Chytridium lagenaria]